MTFEQKEPKVHRLHDELTLVLKTFLTCFLTHEYVNSCRIVKVNAYSENVHTLDRVYVGDAAKLIFRRNGQI